MVLVKCDNCGIEKEVKYQSYNISTNNNTEKFYCSNKECINTKRVIATKKKYGVDNVFQLDNTKEKIKETNIIKFGVENPQQNKKIKEKTESTNLKKYGVKNPFQSEDIKKKMKKTNLKKYGVEFPSQSANIREKMENTSLLNYGFKFPTQNLNHFIDRQKSSLIIKHMGDLYYQGSYEKDFLLKYKDVLHIENGLSIKYNHLDVDKIYHSDFYLPDFDLVVEIKSTYWYNIHLERCQEKAKFTKKIHNYIMILDKDYTEFEKIISKA